MNNVLEDQLNPSIAKDDIPSENEQLLCQRTIKKVGRQLTYGGRC